MHNDVYNNKRRLADMSGLPQIAPPPKVSVRK